MKQFTGQCKRSDLSGLANSVAGDDPSLLADMINKSLKHVSDDLQPVFEDDTALSHQVPDEYIILPETVLAKMNGINVHKASGPDGVGCCEILLHFYTSHCVQCLMPVFAI